MRRRRAGLRGLYPHAGAGRYVDLSQRREAAKAATTTPKRFLTQGTPGRRAQTQSVGCRLAPGGEILLAKIESGKAGGHTARSGPPEHSLRLSGLETSRELHSLTQSTPSRRERKLSQNGQAAKCRIRGAIEGGKGLTACRSGIPHTRFAAKGLGGTAFGRPTARTAGRM